MTCQVVLSCGPPGIDDDTRRNPEVGGGWGVARIAGRRGLAQLSAWWLAPSAPRRSNSAHLHRQWRAILEQSCERPLPPILDRSIIANRAIWACLWVACYARGQPGSLD